MTDAALQRKNMVESQVRPSDVTDRRIMNAMLKIAREKFVPAALASLGETARGAWRVLWINRFRTSLTLLGIVIGVASVIVMLAVGDGARRHVMAQMGAFGASILYLENDRAPDGTPPLGIDEGDLEEIGRLPSVRRVMPTIGDPITVRYGNRDATIYSQGITTDMPSIHRWPVAEGRFFDDREARELAPVVVLGSKVRERFFPGGARGIGHEGVGGRLEHGHVGFGHPGERPAAHAVPEHVLELALVRLEVLHRRFEIMRHERLHRIAVHGDKLAQEADRQHLLGPARLFLHDDLG